MSSLLFGKYLVRKGVVNDRQLALGYQNLHQHNRTLGALAIGRDWLTHDQTDDINQQQVLSDRLFGEVALELELLTAKQVKELMLEQVRHRLSIGEMLLQLGYIKPNQLDHLLADYQYWLQRLQDKRRQYWSGLQGAVLIKAMLDEFAKLFQRFCHARCVMADLQAPLPANYWGSQSLLLQPVMWQRTLLHIGVIYSQDLAACLSEYGEQLPSDNAPERMIFLLDQALQSAYHVLPQRAAENISIQAAIAVESQSLPQHKQAAQFTFASDLTDVQCIVLQ